MTFRWTLLTATLLVAPVAAYAQPITGLYIGGGAGYNLPENPPLASGGVIMPGGGFGGLASIGYGLGNGFRFELEGNYRESPLPSESTFFIASNSGNLHKYCVMVNALYDFNLGVPWLYPYLVPVSATPGRISLASVISRPRTAHW